MLLCRYSLVMVKSKRNFFILHAKEMAGFAIEDAGHVMGSKTAILCTRPAAPPPLKL